MAEEPIAPANPPAPAASAAPAAAPPAPAQPSPAPAAAPAAPAAPVAPAAGEPGAPGGQADGAAKAGEPKAPDAGVKPHTEKATLLEEAAKPGEKPAEKAAEAKVEPKPGEKPAEAKPGEKPAEAPKPPDAAPIAYDIKLPEGIKGEPAVMGELTNLFGAAKIAPEQAQKIIDVGTKAMLAYRDQLHRDQHTTFADTRAGWVKEVLADPVLGGAGHKTAMGAVARMRDLFVPAARQKAFNEFLRVTGAGDHPEFLRMLHNAAAFFDEAPLPPSDPRPPKDHGKPPGKRGLQGLYRENRAARGG